MERKDGVILLRMHTDGGPAVWGMEMHRVLIQAWQDVGNDPENELMILTSTDPFWIGRVDEKEEKDLDFGYDMYYRLATKLVEDLIFNVDIPTIAAVNGPGYHTELALLCDITICSEEAVFQDGHFLLGFVPGDGQLLTFQELLGVKRAGYAMYTAQKIDARKALEWGLVNEVVAKDKLIDRAWELAGTIMQQPRAVRCMTHHLLSRPWKQRLINDFQAHITHEGYGVHVTAPRHELNVIRDSWSGDKS
ncbi:MAG: enoyl-CoA hydratase/isomerase family protein [Gammaproteobacteria bacterium]|nr:MAG: enoyl-CoA hydratase/isomerase family protein [Gammaproteobacteria bacterium]